MCTLLLNNYNFQEHSLRKILDDCANMCVVLLLIIVKGFKNIYPVIECLLNYPPVDYCDYNLSINMKRDS